MKKLLLPLPFVFLMACNTGTKETTSEDTNLEANTGHDHAVDDGHNHGASTETVIYDYKTHDPVCGMERKADWTEFSVYNNDTVKFCMVKCKEKFDKAPESYVKK